MKCLMQVIHGNFCIKWNRTGEEKLLFMGSTRFCSDTIMHFPRLRSECILHPTMMKTLIVVASMREWGELQMHLLCFVRPGTVLRLFTVGKNCQIHDDYASLKKTKSCGREVVSCMISIKHY